MEYPFPNLLLSSNFCPDVRVELIDFIKISVLPIAPAVSTSFFVLIVFLTPLSNLI